jgi:AraC-like DNA-binding protein
VTTRQFLGLWRKLARFKRLVCPEEIRQEADAHEVRIEFKSLLAEELGPTFLTDGAFSSTVLLLSRGTGQSVRPARLELCCAALAERATEPAWIRQVRETLGRGMRGQRPGVQQVARELSVSPRTLQRRLESAGTSFQQVLDEVRQDTARRLLSATELQPAEIAFLLGFEELNFFNRAFIAWDGITPGRWRAARTRH